MILKEDSTEQKLRGAYYTPLSLAEFLVNQLRASSMNATVLEPSCGDGVFLDALKSTKLIDKVSKIDAVEIESDEAEKVGNAYKKRKKVSVICSDFFDFYEKNKDKKYGMIIGNPPYIRYQYLEDHQRRLMSDIIESHGMKSNKLINTWVAFTVACVHMLCEGGVIGFVIPAEILQVAYAEDLRKYLSKQLDEITLITFEELVFPNIEQEIVVLIGKKGTRERKIRVCQTQNIDTLFSLELPAFEFQNVDNDSDKWTKYFTSASESDLVQKIKRDERFHKLSDVALINVGITTGNNKYFSVNERTVDEYGLSSICHPLIGRSSHANSLFFMKEDWQNNVKENKAAFLIDFPDMDIEDYPIGYRKYIETGEKNKENTGYKCRIREKWYRIPSIWVPDAFFLRRNNLYPKFVLNMCDAVSTDTMHRIKFNEGINPKSVILSYYNSISFAFTELCGRSYGGGVLEILPSEVGNIYVPKMNNIPNELIDKTLCRIDSVIRDGLDIEKALDIVDKEILINYLHIEEGMCIMARGIWKKLQERRLNRG